MQKPSHSRRKLLLGLSAVGLAGCARDLSYLPQVDGVFVSKSQRVMYLIKDRLSVARYDVELGFDPLGHKEQEGDGRTPEGNYWVDRKNPNSSFHLSLGISYPNPVDIARAEELGVEPGGDIFIHGKPNKGYDPQDPDWTAGCIAVTNREIEEVYWMVPVGTPITIQA